jgi:hypothetical protein
MTDDAVDRSYAMAGVEAMRRLRDFPENTCSSSRHVQMVAEDMVERGAASLHAIDPVHVGGSIATTIAHLYAARTMLAKLGYTWSIQEGAAPVWERIEPQNPTEAS